MRITEKMLLFVGGSGSYSNYNYYVDQVNGDDSNDGRTLTTPWKTMAKVNASSFSAGDSIGLKKGNVWRETLTVPSSGSSGNPITFGAYGSGSLPRITGCDAVSGSWTSTGLSNQGFFYDDFEANNKLKWTSVVNDSAQIFTSTASAMGGTGTYGLEINITSTTARYVRHLFGSNEKIFRVRFYVDPNTLTMGATDEFILAQIRRISPANDTIIIKLKKSGGVYNIFSTVATDTTTLTTSLFSITDNPHYIEANWAASTSADSNNGYFQLYIDDVLKYNAQNIDNDTWSIGEVRFGVNGLPAGTSGPVYLDQYYSNNTGLYIGPTMPAAAIYSIPFVESSTVNLVMCDDIALEQRASVNAMTYPGTFFHNAGTDTLYVWLPASDNPALHTIEVGQRTNAVSAANKSYLTFNDIYMHGANGTSGACFKIGTTTTQSIGVILNRCRLSGSFYYGAYVTFAAAVTANSGFQLNYCEVDHALRSGVFLEGESTASRCPSMVISGCSIHDNGSTRVGVHGVHSKNTTGLQILNSRIYNNNGSTGASSNIYFNQSVSSVVKYNVVYSGNTSGIHFDTNSNSFTCNYNIVYSQGKNGIWVEEHLRANGTSIMYGNTIYNCEAAIVFNPGTTAFVVSGITVKNNICHLSNSTSFLLNNISVGSDCTDNTVDYNVYWPNTSSLIYVGNFRGNMPVVAFTFAAWKTFTGWDTNSQQSDPLLTNVALPDFTLTSSSPARATGQNLTATYQQAYNGNQGVGNWDIGAYIFV